jgi:Arc/MetJ-type ribon-helix-helix transcriptional regulator
MVKDTIRTTVDLDRNLHFAVQVLVKAGRIRSMREFIRQAVPHYLAHLAAERYRETLRADNQK